MSIAEQVGSAINEVVERINSKALEPAAGRRDWDRQRDALRQARQAYEQHVLDPLEAALEELSESDRESLRFVVTSIGGALAAAHYSAGDRSSASSLLSRALVAGDGTDARHELEAATHDWDSFVLLAHARWLRRNGKIGRANTILERIAKGSRDPLLREIASAILQTPSPLKAAPSLFTVNGCGVMLYGRRDPRPDRSHVATTYVTLLFVPLLPLASYRIIKQPDNRYLFLGRVPLSRIQRYYRSALALAVVLLIAGASFNAWLESPGRRAGLALEKAQAAERAG